MKKLSSCPSCEGFVPSSASSCPHCGAHIRMSTTGRVLRVALAATVGGAFAATLMACYGCPPGGCGVPPTDSGASDGGAGADASTTQEGGTGP